MNSLLNGCIAHVTLLECVTFLITCVDMTVCGLPNKRIELCMKQEVKGFYRNGGWDKTKKERKQTQNA